MIMDKQNMVSEAQAITVDAVSTNTIDLGTVRDVAPGEPLSFSVNIDATFTAGGAATLTIQVISSASADLSGHTVLTQMQSLVLAQLVAGRKPIEIKVQRPFLLNAPVGQRYIGLRYVVATGPMLTGSLTAGLVRSFQDREKHYPSGFAVS